MLSVLSQAAYIALLALFLPLPYATDRRIRRVPWVTYGLIALNFIVFIVFVLPNLGTAHANDVFSRWGLIPRTPSGINLVSYLFLHVSLAHLLWNSAFLWLFGPSGEDALGHFSYLVFYLSGGIVAGLLHVAIVLLFAQNSTAAYAPLVGASGAIAAVVGLYAIRFYRSKLKVVWACAKFLQLGSANFEIPAIFGLGLWFLQNLFGAISSLLSVDRDGIAYWAHIGGFIFGMTVAEVSGMLGEGIREYLFADAVSAGQRGEDGVEEAVRNFQLLLSRRPDDTEVRTALSLLAQQESPKGSPAVRKVVSEAYSILLEQSLASNDNPRTAEWLSAFDDLGADDVIESAGLLRLAEKAARAGETAFAERLNTKVSARFPNTRDALQAALDRALIGLDSGESAAVPIALLQEAVGTRAGSLPREPISPVVSWWRRLGRNPRT